MTLNKLLLAGLASSSLLLTACGGSNGVSSNSTSPTPTPAPTSNPTPTPTPTATPTPTPTPTGTAGVTKVEGPLDPVQDEVVDGVVVAELGSQLPAPLNGVVECVALSLNYLIDAPDAILAGAAGLANGADPYDAFNSSAADVQASLERFAGSLQASLTDLVNRGECSADQDTTAQAGNPLAGTPLEDVGAALQALVASFATDDGQDPNLTSVTNVVAPALAALAVELGNSMPAEVTSAPVLGGLVTTIEAAATDLADLLGSVGAYDAASTTADAQMLIGNLLTGLLLDTLPVAEVDPAVAAQIQAGIATLTSTLGSGLGQVVTPLFNEGLNGVASPLLDPVEGLLAGILASGNPLDGVLAVFGGDLANTDADALFGLILSTASGTPLQNLVVAAGGTATNSSSPLALLGQLQTVLGAGGLDSILGNAVTQNNNLGASLGTILDSLLGDGVLTGLLGL